MLKYRQYFCILQTLKLNNENNLFYKKTFGRIDSRSQSDKINAFLQKDQFSLTYIFCAFLCFVFDLDWLEQFYADNFVLSNSF